MAPDIQQRWSDVHVIPDLGFIVCFLPAYLSNVVRVAFFTIPYIARGQRVPLPVVVGFSLSCIPGTWILALLWKRGPANYYPKQNFIVTSWCVLLAL
jgi:hypothetical protein